MASCLAAFEPYPATKGYGSFGNLWQPASSDAAYHQQAGIVEPYPTGIWVPESLSCDYLPPGVTRVLSVTDRCPFSMRMRTDWAVRDFVFVKEIGTGNASTVWYAFCKKTSAPLAIKTYKKRKLSPLNRCQVAREINIHSQLDHPNVIALYAAFEDNDKVYLLQEYAEGGDLFDEMKRTMGRMPENQLVTAVLLPMMSALLAMHSAGFIHRDIKPENTLFAAGRVLKLADFGLAVNHVIERPVTRLGTLDYMAPEVLVCPDKHMPTDNKERSDLWYTPAVDAWALGVLAYELAVGRPPFGMSTRDETIRAIRQSPPGFPEFMSPGLVDYISHALVKPADQRSTLAELMQHPWIMEHARRAGMDAQVLAYLRVHQPAEKQLLLSSAVAAGGGSNASGLQQQQQQQPAITAAPAGPMPPAQQQQQQSLMAQHTPAAAAAAAGSVLPEGALVATADSSSAAVPSITVTSPTLAGHGAAATPASAVSPAAAAAAASYLAGLMSPEPHMMMLGADVAAAAGMASGGPPRVKKTAKRTALPRCFSSKNVAGLSSFTAAGGGHQQGMPHGHGHIHWHANGETLALHVPGLMLDMAGSDSPRSNSPNASSPTAMTAGLGGRAAMTRAASLISPLHINHHKHQQLQDGYNPMYGGLGSLVPGLAGMQAAAAAASAANLQQQQHGALPGSPTRRALAAARMNGGSNGSSGSKQTSSSKRCTPEPDSDLALTLLALGQSSPSSSNGTDVISPQLVQQQQLMQQYLRQQQQMQLQGSGPAAVNANVQLQGPSAAVHCQVHGSFVSPNASPRPMSRLGVSGLSSSGSTGPYGIPPVGVGVNALLGQQQHQQQGQYASMCNCSCGSGTSVSAAASAAGSSSGRSSGTKFSPCSPVLKVVAQHQFESPLKRVNSHGTLTGHSSSTAAAQLAPQLSLPLPPMHQQQHKQAEQQQVSGVMMAAELDRLQQAAAAAGAHRSSAATPTPAQQAAAAAAGPGHRQTGGSSAEGSSHSAQASPAGLHMQELVDVLSSPGSVANLLQEHQQQQLQRELAAQQYVEQQQQQLCSRRLNDMRRPVMRACSAPSLLHPALQLQLLQQQQQQQGYGWFDGLSGGSPTSNAPHDLLGAAAAGAAAAAAAAAAAEVSALEQMQFAAQQHQQFAQGSPFASIGAALSSMDCSTPASPNAAAAGLARVNSTGASTAEQLQQLCHAAGSTVLHGQLSIQMNGNANSQLPPSGAHLHSVPLYRATSPGLAMLQQQQQNTGQLPHAGTSWDAAASLAGSMQLNSYAAGAAMNGLDVSPGQHAVNGYDAGPASVRTSGLSRSQSLLSDLGPLQTVPESSAATYEQLPSVLGTQPCSTNWQQQQQLQAQQQQQLQEIAGALLLQQQQQAQAAQQQQQQQAMQLQMCGGSGAFAGATDVFHLAAMACSQGNNSTLNPVGNTSPLNPRLLMRHAPSRLAQASSPLPPQAAAAAQEL